MIRAEVDGSELELLLLAVGCRAFKVGVALGVGEIVGLSDAGPSSTGAVALLDFFFFVIFSILL